MSTPLAISSGSFSTSSTIGPGCSVLTMAQAVDVTLNVYDGSTSGKLLVTVTSSNHVPINIPVQVSSTLGIYCSVSSTTGSALIHYA